MTTKSISISATYVADSAGGGDSQNQRLTTITVGSTTFVVNKHSKENNWRAIRRALLNLAIAS